ncbi:MAG: polyketide cyclase / dehydrase and lipid transport, partial [Actinomycetota bacterium]|nr:polyketide cyclase / dehydrase and lipid transport [Actinomycetota bacterium]
MDKVRAEILDLGLPRTTADRIIIDAPAEQIFDLIADPRAHSLFDGSGTLQGSISGPERLYLGAKFAMAMKIRVP